MSRPLSLTYSMDRIDSETIEMSLPNVRSVTDSVHYLVVVEGEQLGTRKEIPASMTIGRDTSCRLRFQDPGVSKVHCRVQLDGQRVVVRDLGSTNGSYVEGRRIADAVELHVGGLLQVGAQVLLHEFRSRAEVERERELAHDLEKARDYVAALIPAPLTTGGLRTDWSYVPSAVLGGDLFGYHAIDATRTALYLLDVCGHGAGAAMHSASVFNVIRNGTLASTDFGRPEQVLERLNESFQMERHGGMYLTLWYGVYDARARMLDYASAGHPPALLKRAGELHRLQTRHPPIGVDEGRRFARECVPTLQNDRLYLFSDGVFEFSARDGRQWSLEDLERLVQDEERLGVAESSRLFDALSHAKRDERFEDDFSLLVVSFD